MDARGHFPRTDVGHHRVRAHLGSSRLSTPTIAALDLGAVWAAEPPRIDFVLPGLAAGTVGMVVAAGGTGKTFVMLATALSVAVGRDVGDIWGGGLTSGHAVFLSLEDPEVALHARLHSLKPLLQDDGEVATARERLHVLPYAGHGLSFASPSDSEPELTEWFGKLKAYLAAIRPRLCVVDTLNRALGGISENDAGAMGWIIGQLERLAREVGCAVVLCHHVSKQALTLSMAGEAHAARGSSVITDNARWQCNLSTPNDKDARFKGKSEVERRCFVHLAFSKTNYGPPVEPRWLRRSDDGVLRRHDGPTHAVSGAPPSRRPPRERAARTVASAAPAAAGTPVAEKRRKPAKPSPFGVMGMKVA